MELVTGMEKRESELRVVLEVPWPMNDWRASRRGKQGVLSHAAAVNF